MSEKLFSVVAAFFCLSTYLSGSALMAQEVPKPKGKVSAEFGGQAIVNGGAATPIAGGGKGEARVLVPNFGGTSTEHAFEIGFGKVGANYIGNGSWGFTHEIVKKGGGFEAIMSGDCTVQNCLMGMLTGGYFRAGGGTVHIDGRYPLLGGFVINRNKSDGQAGSWTLAGMRVGFDRKIGGFLDLSAYLEGDLTGSPLGKVGTRQIGAGFYGKAGLQAKLALLKRRLILSAEAVAEENHQKIETDKNGLVTSRIVNNFGVTGGVGARVAF